jgi:hypothetical protein
MTVSVLIRIVLIVALIVVFVLMKRKQRQASGGKPAAKPAATETGAARPQPKAERSPEEIYMGLRKKAFAAVPERLGLSGAVAEGQAYGGVMEMGLSASVVTLVCLANGEASVYYRTGGGMVGGGGHENVRKVAQSFVEKLQRALPVMQPSPEQPLPGVDQIRFYALTPKGIRFVERSREQLGEFFEEKTTVGPDAELASLFRAGQVVVTEMRLVQEQRTA